MAREYTITTDPSRFDLDVIHDFLRTAYWSKNIPREIVMRAIENSLCFGCLDAKGGQVGFARVITDYATFAYIADVFIVEEARGRGLSRLMMETILADSRLQGLRRWLLVTRDAYGLYGKMGFSPAANPAGFMEIHDPYVYTSNGEETVQ